METQHAERIILIGPTGSGKTTTGRLVAARLGWSFVDTDALVVQRAGRPIPDIFAVEGEPRFRELESAALAEALERRHVVVATGGGIGERAENVELMCSRGWVVMLSCGAETALGRLRTEAATHESVGAARPMLAGHDPLARMQELEARRGSWYAVNDECISTEGISGEEAVSRVLAGLAARGLLPSEGAAPHTYSIGAGREMYDAVVEWGGLASLGERLAALDMPARLHVVADAAVAALYERILAETLIHAGFEPAFHCVPSGEASKSAERLGAIYDWLAERRAERSEAVVAVGGGVIGDLAGFAAATYLRGMPLMQVPTSLLAQVDASIGGKVAIDHPRGKNLIGAFYPPRLVVADPAALLTLPRRQLVEGWAEVVKHGVALDAAYFERLERDVEGLLALHPAATTAAVAGSVALKGGVVEGDEREGEGGRRHLLNYGHTIGHAIEAVAGYGAWLHGEAVAVGMMVAARIGQRCGITPDSLVARQEGLLTRFGLPTRLDSRGDRFSADALLRAALWDKKVRGGQVRWVLPSRLGNASLVAGVRDDDVRAVLLEVGAVDDEPPQD